MRLRSFIWSDNLPHGSIYKCRKPVATNHLFNCNRFITFRSKVHETVRDQFYCIFKSYKIKSFLEPLLSNLANEADRNFFGDCHGDLLVPGLHGSMIIIDVRSTAVSNSSNEKLAQSCLRGRYDAAKQSLLSSSLADANSVTLEKLQKLHLQENFKCSKPEVCPFWIENPITAIEVLKAIQKLPKGKAAGPSGISFDLLKIACCSAPEIADDLAQYFQQLIVLKINPPFELLAVRLIALVKPGNGIKPDGIHPIAVGESLSRLLASIVFDRVKDKASTFLNPHQFGIKTIDGASVAAIASDTFFSAEENNFIFNLDFKNAFNSVKREAIFEVIKSDFPELSSFFYHFYGKESDLIYNSFGLKSSSGVKQGDPLGPLLFCLAIHKNFKYH
ncbi:hypothetical protein P9112_005893 [Eukaryota sp. TZLM1-RC]